MLNRLKRAVNNGYLSAPHFPPLPAAHPFHVAICTVRLAVGCQAPPGPIPFRVASGAGPTKQDAAFIALSEAAERFSLQYSENRSRRLDPIFTLGGEAKAVEQQDLAIGAPGSANKVLSKGAAAGVSLDDAADRAVLELLEHHHIDRFDAGLEEFEPIDPSGQTILAPHLAFLSTQLRRIHIGALVSEHGYIVVRTVCCDHDGGRPTVGSAAGWNADGTILRASEEAMLLWRNMIELERTGADVSGADGGTADAIRVYRGADHLPRSRQDLRVSACLPPLPRRGLPSAEVIGAVTGRRVRLFDMSVPELAVSVVRALLG